MNLNHEKMKVGKVVDETVDIEDIDIAIKRIEGSIPEDIFDTKLMKVDGIYDWNCLLSLFGYLENKRENGYYIEQLEKGYLLYELDSENGEDIEELKERECKYLSDDESERSDDESERSDDETERSDDES